MPIRYIHNDPGSLPLLESLPEPLPAWRGRKARYRLGRLPPPAVYAAASPEFVDWQCREAALRTLEIWEAIAGPLRAWQGERAMLKLLPRRATGIAASYERDAIGFDHWPADAPTFYVGASTDAVSHEVGHAILDALRPTLWESLFSEVAAFHEGFADCVSLLVGLFDDTVRGDLFAAAPRPIAVLGAGNRVARVAESVALTVQSALGATHPAARPRQLKNDLQWSIPTTLPPNPTVDNLSREPHSFGRVFAGCFYDCVDNIYRTSDVHTAAGLRAAAAVAGSLLAAAIETAPEEIRFFRSVGRAMIHADGMAHGGRHHLAIRDAFAAHSVALGSSAQLAPTMALDGPAPLGAAAAGRPLNARTRRDLATRTGARAGTRISTTPLRVGDARVVRAALRQPLPLRVPGREDVEITGRVNEEVLLGTQRERCVLLGELPNQQASQDEVDAFVQAISESGDLHGEPLDRPRTHALRRRGSRTTLQRVRFSCCAGVWPGRR